ncbi:hypothetical protein ABKN59_009045 [Abortiporus biennis]
MYPLSSSSEPITVMIPLDRHTCVTVIYHDQGTSCRGDICSHTIENTKIANMIPWLSDCDRSLDLEVVSLILAMGATDTIWRTKYHQFLLFVLNSIFLVNLNNCGIIDRIMEEALTVTRTGMNASKYIISFRDSSCFFVVKFHQYDITSHDVNVGSQLLNSYKLKTLNRLLHQIEFDYQSIKSTSTIASGSTAASGIGSLSGRGIMIAGQWLLEQVRILRIRARIRGIEREARNKNWKSLNDSSYRDIMELQRRNLYPEDINTRAWNIILTLLCDFSNHDKIISVMETVWVNSPGECKLFLQQLAISALCDWKLHPSQICFKMIDRETMMSPLDRKADEMTNNRVGRLVDICLQSFLMAALQRLTDWIPSNLALDRYILPPITGRGGLFSDYSIVYSELFRRVGLYKEVKRIPLMTYICCRPSGY